MDERKTPAPDLLFDDPAAYRQALKERPLDPYLHLDFALFCLTREQLDLGFAELRTARHLGVRHPELEQLLSKVAARERSLETLDHNQFYRLRTLTDFISGLSRDENPSVLDIGGGHGLLARFLPGASYCLVEPDVNGISALELPFAEASFDFVVACHVLEHISDDRRNLFLDQLRATARSHVILLNPFQLQGSAEEERLRLVHRITGAEWAREHLDCKLPKLETILEYAGGRGLEVDVHPNGTKTTSLAYTLVTHFARQAGRVDELNQINRFFNTRLDAILTSDSAPNAHLVHFDLTKESPVG